MTDGAREQHEPPDDDFGLSAVRELLRLISDTDITEIQIERGDSKLHIKRGPVAQSAPPLLVTPSLATTLQPAITSPPSSAPFPQHAAGAAHTQSAEAREEMAPPAGPAITAPMVGTFYSAPSPKDAPYVQEGDTVHVGDVIGIIETMKMMNEIESEVAGRVARILVKNGQPVEYGQPLIVIEPL